jgi:hypothetical protein
MTCHPAPLPRPEPSPKEINAFLDLADRQISAPRQARRRRLVEAPRQTTEREQLSAAWRQWHSERHAALVAGPHGDAVGRLFDFLDGMTLDQGAALIELIKGGPWRQAAADTRFEVLALIDTAIVGLRTRSGLSPFDDALPGNRPNVFLGIREVLA